MNNTSLNHYINQRLNLSWVAEETGINYKRLVNSMKLLEDIVQGLAIMHKIDIPEEYLKDYYDKEGNGRDLSYHIDSSSIREEDSVEYLRILIELGFLLQNNYKKFVQ